MIAIVILDTNLSKRMVEMNGWDVYSVLRKIRLPSPTAA